MNEGEIETVWSWLNALPEDMVRNSAPLSVAYWLGALAQGPDRRDRGAPGGCRARPGERVASNGFDKDAVAALCPAARGTRYPALVRRSL